MKRNPRKRKYTAMMHSGMKPKKKKKAHTYNRKLFCHCLQLLQELLTMSERGKNEKLLVSANIEQLRLIYSTKQSQLLICINLPPKLIES